MTSDRTYRVLIADDSAFAQRMVKRALDKSEFIIAAEASSDDEAVAKYQENPPDLVLLDVIMPKSGGLEALSRILTLNSAARVVMLSSLGTEDTVGECLKRGARTFINKPFEDAALLACLRKVATA